MIHILKGAEPTALTTYRETPDASVDPPRRARYDGPGFEAVKPAVREALVRDQHALCCYCNDRISPTPDGMKVEHHAPQSAHPDLDLVWANLMGACVGEASNPRGRGANVTYCDSAKAERSLTLDPTNAAHMQSIGYERSGRVTSRFAEHQRSIDDVLNLNAGVLLDRRTRAVNALTRELSSRYGARDLPRAKLEKLRDHLANEAGPRRPFLGFLLWWLARAIQKAR